MTGGRVVIIPFLHGRVGLDGVVGEPDIDDILRRWKERHPELVKDHRDFHIIKSLSHTTGDGLETRLVRVTADAKPFFDGYDPSADLDLYEEFLAEFDHAPKIEPHKRWVEQCKAAQNIADEFGTDKAMGYLIGEKLLNFLDVAEKRLEWRAELPTFLDTIKELFDESEIADFFSEPRRLGALGHTADEVGHRMLRGPDNDEANIREDARNLVLFEWARDLLLGDPR